MSELWTCDYCVNDVLRLCFVLSVREALYCSELISSRGIFLMLGFVWAVVSSTSCCQLTIGCGVQKSKYNAIGKFSEHGNELSLLAKIA